MNCDGNMIEIKPAQLIDIPILRAIAIETQVDTFGEHNTQENMQAFLKDAYDFAQFSREFRETESIYYIAWEGETAAGFLRLRRSAEADAFLGENSIELQRLYVTKDFLGKKVGAKLMAQALRYARDRKFEWIWLGVWEKNSKAQEFYKKWSFERFSEHIFWLGADPQTDWLLKLKL